MSIGAPCFSKKKRDYGWKFQERFQNLDDLVTGTVKIKKLSSCLTKELIT